MDDSLGVNITGCLYNSSGYLENPDTCLAAVNAALDAISGFAYEGISLSINSVGDKFGLSIVLPIYNYTRYLSSVNSATLRNDIISALGTVANFSFNDVSVSSSRSG